MCRRCIIATIHGAGDRKWESIPAQARIEKHYAEAAKSGRFQGCAAYADYRDVLQREDLDAVVIATPDHWHARIALDAIRSGKAVYCEKPVTHFFAEGQAVVRAAEAQQTIFQVGSQQRSDATFRRAVELVRNGRLGNLLTIEVGLPPGYEQALDDTTPSDPPPGLDYDMWCGPAPKLDYMRATPSLVARDLRLRWWSVDGLDRTPQ